MGRAVQCVTSVPRFFIISINYAPEPTGFAPHAAALAEYLAQRGHEVSVFTGFPFAPAWRRRASDRGRWFLKERTNRLTVQRLTHFIPRQPSSVPQRLVMEGSFALAGMVAMAATMAAQGRPDAILYIGAQPAVAMAARIIAGFAGRPYVVNVNDLAASAARDVGMVGGHLHQLLEAFEFAAYRGATAASVLSRSFEEALVMHGYPRDRIQLIRSPVDLERIRPRARDSTFRAKYDIPESAFVILQAGSMGRKQGLMNVVVAAGLAQETRLCWVLVGDGESRQTLMEAAHAAHLEDVVRFVPFQAEMDMSAMFAAADVLLLNQVASVKDAVIPSKLLMYMAAGLSVLAAVNRNSQGAEILEESQGGVIVSPENPQALSTAALELAGLPRETLAAYGARNRAYAETHFDQRVILAAHEAMLLGVADAARSSSR